MSTELERAYDKKCSECDQLQKELKKLRAGPREYGFLRCPSGFHVAFKNGYTVSVQFGVANYCDAQNLRPGALEESLAMEYWSAGTAEVAVKHKREFVRTPFNDGDDVIGHCTAEDVFAIMAWAMSQPRMF